jgi:putative hydrolase of the HAD superfamily
VSDAAAPITAVVSDFFGVLTTPLSDAFDAVRAALQIPPTALNEAMQHVAERDGAHPLFELECGRMTEPDFHRVVDDAVRELHGVPSRIETFNDHYFGALHLCRPMADAVRRARAAGYRTSLLTNNVREWEPRWRAMFPVDELFDDVVDSAYVGMRKPDPAIYRLTCERLGVPAAQCVFVDDFAHNCEAAREVGMTAIEFRNPEQAVADLEAVLARRGTPAPC